MTDDEELTTYTGSNAQKLMKGKLLNMQKSCLCKGDESEYFLGNRSPK